MLSKQMIQKLLFFILALGLVLFSACERDYLNRLNCDSEFQSIEASAVINRIAFGSCANQNDSQPILLAAAEQHPNLFVYLGDNIYGDTECMSTLADKYQLLCSKSEFQTLQATCPILATWDDHDYGLNDGGSEYAKKKESKEVFMKFWGQEKNTARQSHSGIYDAVILGSGQQTIQLILLDLRTFRSSMNYQPNYDSQATMLGTAQWQWLEEQLLQQASIRIIASSIQFGSSFHGFESWNNFPLEQEKLYALIQSTQAEGVFIISGDMHYGELSRRNPENLYPFYDFTSSGITETYPPVENLNRIGNAVENHHFGQIDINWNGDSTHIGFSLIDVNGITRFESGIYLNELRF